MTPTMSMVRLARLGAQGKAGAPTLQRTSSFLSSNRVEYRASTTSERERAKSVTAFYNQPAVETAAKKVGPSRCYRKLRLVAKDCNYFIAANNSFHFWPGEELSSGIV